MSDEKGPSWTTGAPFWVGVIAIVALVGGLGTWSLLTQIAGAVVAQGQLAVEDERQVVQHPDGGVVGEILAREGDRVAAGDVVVRFDGTFMRSELSVVERQLLELSARRARLEAERDGAESPDFDTVSAGDLNPEWVADQIEGQRNLFAARRESLAREVDQLREQQTQIGNQIEGLTSQRRAQSRQFELISDELADQESLLDRGLVPIARVLELRREAAGLEGEIGRLDASIAEARGRIAGNEIQIVGLENQRREESITRLRDLRYSEIELEERAISLRERLARLDVRAPVDGTVFGMEVSTIQSVVQPAQQILSVVPGEAPLQVLARIDPVHVDQVRAGQDVVLRFSTFNQREMPEVAGRITRVSADTVTDEVTGARYYEAVVQPDPEAVADLPVGTELIPGMPVEAYMRTADRTPLSYLTQPLTTYFNRAFRES